MAAAAVLVLTALAGFPAEIATPAATGSASAATAGTSVVELRISVRGRAPTSQRAALSCRGRFNRAGGYLARSDPRVLCARARRLAPFLARRPDATRLCTKVYGGPETALMRGTVGGRRVDRFLSRRDGCEIADWDRAAGLLPPAPSSSSPRAE